MPYRQPPRDTFGRATLKGAGVGLAAGLIGTEGIPTPAVAATTAIGAAIGAGRHIVQSVKFANEKTRIKKAGEAIRARHAATSDSQFGKTDNTNNEA